MANKLLKIFTSVCIIIALIGSLVTAGVISGPIIFDDWDEILPDGIPEEDNGFTPDVEDGFTPDVDDGFTGDVEDGFTGNDINPNLYDSGDGFNDAGTITDWFDDPTIGDDDPFPTEFPPIAKAGGPYRAEVDEEVVFDGSNSYDPDGQIVQYSWNLGDGERSYQIYPRKSFDKEGLYIVSLTVTDNDGKTDIAYASVLVIDEDDNYDDDRIIIDGKLAVSARMAGGEQATAGSEAVLRTNVENIGDEDLEDIQITMTIPELGLRDVEGPFKLKDGNSVSKSLQVDIPEYAAAGVYTVRISYSNDEMRREIHREITVI